MKTLTWRVVLPLSIIIFTIFTKWWYVLPVDTPDTMMSGFPLISMSDGWHTSFSYQIFILEFISNFLIGFLFWFLITLFFHKVVKIKGSLTIFALPIQRCLPRCSNYLKNSGASTTGFIKNQFVAKIVKEPNQISQDFY